MSENGLVLVSLANEVIARALVALNTAEFAAVMQSAPENALLGVSERCGLLRSFGGSLISMPEVFGLDEVRPGNIVGMSHLFHRKGRPH